MSKTRPGAFRKAFGSKVLFQKLMDNHGFKKFDAFYGSRTCVYVLLLWRIRILTLAPHFCMRRVSASECHTKSPSFRFSYSKLCTHTLSHLFSNIFRGLSLQCERISTFMFYVWDKYFATVKIHISVFWFMTTWPKFQRNMLQTASKMIC